MNKKINSVLALLPGVLLLIAVGYAGKLSERALNAYIKSHHIVFSNIEYVLWAIIFGLIVVNAAEFIPRAKLLFERDGVFFPGIQTYEFFLKVGIVLLGARFLLVDVLRLGGVVLALVVVTIVSSLALMTGLGRLFGLDPKLTSLLAVGSGICGVSAITATRGAIDADEEDVTIASMAILSLGAIALFAFPLVGHALHLSDKVFGLWAGLGVDNTAEAAATGALYSDAAGKLAVLVKTCRNAMIGFVVLGYAIYWAKQGMAKQIEKKGAFLWAAFPKFVLGFIVVSALASANVFDKTQLISLANASRWALLLTFAGIGLRANIPKMLKQGLRPFVVGLLGEIGISLLTLGMILAAKQLSAL